MTLSLKYIYYGCRNTVLKMFNLINNSLRLIKYTLYVNLDNARLKKLLANSANKTLVFLNLLGGGTEKYARQNFYKPDYCLLTQSNYLNGFCYSLFDTNLRKNIFFKTEDLSTVVANGFKQIIVNSLGGFTAETEILDLLTTVKENSKNVSLLYLVHDFHSICPSVHLHYGECYCKMECTKCGNDVYRSIAPERQRRWFSFLSVCDEIRTFSLSSKKLLLSKYPNLIEQQITVVPHDMSYCNYEPLLIEKSHKPRIAIVGTIMSIYKGMTVVWEFLKYCVSKDVVVYIVGTLCSDYIVKANNIHYLGKYKPQDLNNILQLNKINAVFFPSVLPETFSYLVHELMMMQIPIVGFDIGAQGEFLSNYKYGLTLPINSKIEGIYDALIALSNK